MSIIWIGDSDEYVAGLTDSANPDYQLLNPWEQPDADVEIRGLLVCANAGTGQRSRRLGLRWLQQFRRERYCRAPALVYSFETREILAKHFPLLDSKMPGIDYFRLPSTSRDVDERLGAVVPLTPSELQEFIRWYSGLQRDWRKFAHDLASTLNTWPQNRDRSKRKVEDWRMSICTYAPDQVYLLDELENAISTSRNTDSSTTKRISVMIQRLEDGLCVRPQEMEGFRSEIPEAPYRRPPRGLSTIAIADDHGYELDTIDELRRLGYLVGGPAQTLEEARNLLWYWCPKVFLADLNFPSRAEGLEIINEGLSANCLVIAVSRAGTESGDLPEGVEDCCGALNFQDAGRIHRLIWKHALSKGITAHD